MAASQSRSAEEPEGRSAAMPAIHLEGLAPLPSEPSIVPGTPASLPPLISAPQHPRLPDTGQVLTTSARLPTEQQRLHEEQLAGTAYEADARMALNTAAACQMQTATSRTSPTAPLSPTPETSPSALPLPTSSHPAASSPSAASTPEAAATLAQVSSSSSSRSSSGPSSRLDTRNDHSSTPEQELRQKIAQLTLELAAVSSERDRLRSERDVFSASKALSVVEVQGLEDEQSRTAVQPQCAGAEEEEEEWKNGAEKWEKIVPPRLGWWLEDLNRRSRQPRASREVLPILDLLAAQEDPAELERLKRMHERDEAELAKRSKDVWDDIRKGEIRQRKERRWRENLCIREYWDRYVKFENDNGMKSEKRIRARLERFASDKFPFLAERNEAERQAGYPEGTD